MNQFSLRIAHARLSHDIIIILKLFGAALVVFEQEAKYRNTSLTGYFKKIGILKRINTLANQSRLTLTCIVLLYGIQAFSQSPPQVIPPSPDAAAFAKYGEIPVSTYTGIPNISIPLYMVKTGIVDMPISLSYHAGGVKVEDMASNIGLGWTLNAGGSITRTVMGLPDDTGTIGFFYNYLNSDMSNSDSYLKQIAGPPNQIDALPDIYYFNFGKYSGKFIFSKSGICYSIPHHNFKIKPAVGPQNGGTNKWEILTEEGIKYIFAKTESMEISTACESSGGISGSGKDIEAYTCTWYLTRVEEFHTANVIDLKYFSIPQVSYDRTSSYSRTLTFDEEQPGCGLPGYECLGNFTTSCTTFTVARYYSVLTGISYPGGSLEFSNAPRLDFPDAVRVTGVSIKNYKGELIKRFVFDNNSYFSTCSAVKCKRLKLNSVTEVANDGTLQSPYTFEYDPENLPPRDSYDTDHWGYYNKRNNSYGYPEFIDYFEEEPRYDYLPGDNKRPNLIGTRACTLIKITYPTGGYTQFQYELNEVVSVRLPNKTNPPITISITGPPNKESPMFSIKGYFQNGLYVKVKYQTLGCSTSDIPSFEDNCPVLRVMGVNGTQGNYIFQSSTMQESVFFLPNGQYKLKGQDAITGQSFSFSLTYEPEINSPNKFAGGLRVVSITSADGKNQNPSLTRTYSYNYMDDITTGRNGTYPKYFFHKTNYRTVNITLPVEFKVPMFTVTSSTNTTLATTHGSYVGYGKVTEIKSGSGEIIKSEYYYTSEWKSEMDGDTDFLDTYVNSQPFGPPQEDNEWKRGFLTMKKDYKYKEGSISPFRTVTNRYKIIGNPVEIRGIKSFIKVNHELTPNNNEYQTSLIRRRGNLSYQLIHSEDSRSVANGGTTIWTDCTYSPIFHQLTEQTKTIIQDYVEPTNKWLIKTKYKYPTDYTSSAASDTMALAIKAMMTRNMISTVIEQQVWEQKFKTSKLLEVQINYFYQNGYDRKSLAKLQMDIALTEGQYTESYIDGSGIFRTHPEIKNYQVFKSYEPETGSLQEFCNNDGIHKSYVWAHNHQYPVAEFTGAKLNEIFYTSFEDIGEGNSASGDAKTGSVSKVGGFTKQLFNIPNGSYVLSYYNKTLNGWQPQFINVTVTGSFYTISLAGQVDEVRFFPAGTMVTTYAYSPGIGLISTCDQNNQISNYYEYDACGRLKILRDGERNIMKVFDYNYRAK